MGGTPHEPLAQMFGLGWVGLGWVGLDWVGLGWIGLGMGCVSELNHGMPTPPQALSTWL